MHNNRKIRVAVIYGGRSAEHEISLRSATSVIKNLDPARFDVVPVGIDKQGRWLSNDVSLLEYDAAGMLSLPHTDQEVILPPYNAAELLPTLHEGPRRPFDVIFPVLHGPLGEDGTIQGLFELANVPYVGPGVLCSAVAMDKDVAKRLVAAEGVNTPAFYALTHGQWLANKNMFLDKVSTHLGFPVFVKPANLGSSVGIHKVKSADQLNAALLDAFQYDTKVLIEKGIDAREIEFAVLENPDELGAPLVSIAGEIIPTHEFYSYEAKYLDENGAHLVVPADLTAEQVRQGQELARRAFTALNGEGMMRVDLFLDRKTGEFLFNEANTIPGFTSISMYPKLWEASGVPYTHLLTQLIELAMARFQRKSQLKRTREIEGEV